MSNANISELLKSDVQIIKDAEIVLQAESMTRGRRTSDEVCFYC